ncbi:MAG: hypothetical protein ISQ88_06980 [Rhodobacteraceae bacterium]|nr:hypothetical protein [Paracoccaceae bacterium]
MSNALWFQRTVYSVISLLFIIWLISPQNSLPQAIPAPEFLLCLTLVVILRKPEVLPVILIAIIFLFCDFLFSRPVGLWSGIVIILTEFTKAQYWRYKGSNFVTTWLFSSFVIAFGIGTYILILILFVVPHTNLSQYLVWVLITIFSYPIMFCLSFLVVRSDKKNYQDRVLGGRA